MSTAASIKMINGRRNDATFSFVQYPLIIVGLMLLVGSVKPSSQMGAFAETLEVSVAAPVELPAPTIDEFSTGPLVTPPKPETLTPRMERALDFVSRRYKVAPEALVPVFRAAQAVAREHRLDPLLIIAMIGIESRFNPFAESVSGAKGLMQVIPGIHLDKVPQGAGDQPFLDPVTNIQVGVQVLEEAIRWRGSLTAGLQHYGGAFDDPEQEYANRVYAEKQRLEQAVRRGSGSRV
ncbi:MAG TPA: transglycosylase SLT domain-containing protein [Accumulibacter sp.]|nr:transglycosylase SLT domain-containing protein [Accumulibacter sp.]HMW18515.1 transglycosylase SLT domain-containing protein [Accumulibacter sp.]HNC18847.1 transglycosylase SLT domain-containing protein [Accumulibacter sp.]HND81663.1 transglycosylase SLT domain-containing protein [Accumulibacter sp.]HNE13894.1 transglycosylase SLT domain-containing protein [Accumulibacter sp.]